MIIYIMPGIHFVFNKSPNENKLHLLEDGEIKVQEKISLDNGMLFFSGFKGYPYFIINNKDLFCIIEGMIYNRDKKDIINDIANLPEVENKIEYFKKIIEKYSGEYIILIYLIKEKVYYLLNDAWGRLPLFYYINKNEAIISRELKFIIPYMDDLKLDKYALIEYCSLRYTLGNKTIFSKVYKLEPGQIITLSNEVISIQTICPLNFTRKTIYKNINYAEKAKLILQNTIENIINKLDGFETVTADLSGGYDTRAVVASLSKFKNNFIANTIDLITGSEAETAKKISESLKINLIYIKPNRLGEEDRYIKVIELTDALVNVRTAASCWSNHVELTNRLNRPIACFQGFGGEFLRHPIKKKHHKNIMDVYLDDLYSNTILLSLAESLYGLSGYI